MYIYTVASLLTLPESTLDPHVYDVIAKVADGLAFTEERKYLIIELATKLLNEYHAEGPLSYDDPVVWFRHITNNHSELCSSICDILRDDNEIKAWMVLNSTVVVVECISKEAGDRARKAITQLFSGDINERVIGQYFSMSIKGHQVVLL